MKRLKRHLANMSGALLVLKHNLTNCDSRHMQNRTAKLKQNNGLKN